MNFESTLAFARKMDEKDPLRGFRSQFLIPEQDGIPKIYFCGNSLGLQPVSAEKAIQTELKQWREKAIDGFFEGSNPWLSYHTYIQKHLADIVGANTEEVVAMNTLTVNLHLLMVSFYRPSGKRFKILMEAGAFPSDQYAVESQVKWHGYLPADAIVEISPREGEHLLHTEDIVAAIEKEGDSLAMVLFSGVQYYTGQFFDLSTITDAAHRAGARAGFDLAHAVGNVPLHLHDWQVDFACWCSYKYLNSGPGGPGGVFVHENHHQSPDLPRFAGWWGHNEEERFKMEKGFKPIIGAAGWQVSTAQILSLAPHRASLELFSQAGLSELREKSLSLTGYLEFFLNALRVKGHELDIITSNVPNERGCQLSVLTGANGRKLFDWLTENGVVVDWREPNVIRIAPVPLYNSFEEVWQFADILARFEG